MPRHRAEDYGSKRHEILDAAAMLFAHTGFASAKMEDVARVCGASKSMLYHYFPTKECVLFEILREHLGSLLEAAEEILSRASPPEQRLRDFIHMWVVRSAEARTRHTVLMYDLRFLPRRQQQPITHHERRLLELLAGLLGQVSPRACRFTQDGRSYALLLFGMLNWTDVWYRRTGPVTPEAMSDRIFRTFLNGLTAGT